MHPARYPALLALLVALFLLPLRAEETPRDTSLQSGKLATVRLLKFARLPAKESAPTGMAFLFLVAPAAGVNGGFTLNETKDFQVAGGSYQEKAQAELGKRFEPGTQVMGAEKFFVDNPRLKPGGVDIPKGAVVISLMIRGGTLPSDAKADVTLNVGYEKQAEPFTFSVPVPAG